MKGRRLESHRPRGDHSLGGGHRISHPSLDTLGLSSEPIEVNASVDGVRGFRYRLPSVSQILIDPCGGVPRPRRSRILMGRIHTQGGESAGRRSLRVFAETPPYDMARTAAPPSREFGETLPVWSTNGEWLETTTDARGIFLLRDVPVPVSAVGATEISVEILAEAGASQFWRISLEAEPPVQVVTLTLSPPKG